MQRPYSAERAVKEHRSTKEDPRSTSSIVSQFSLKNVSKFDTDFPFFRKPQEIGHFSHDAQGTFCDDASQLKYYIAPKDPGNVYFDLTKGYSDFVRKDESNLLDSMLHWILAHKEKFAVQSQEPHVDSLHTDFVCWRGLLTRLSCCPYERQDDWKMAVILFKGTYYLCELETVRKQKQKTEMTQRQDEMSYWGWKFEQYITAANPSNRPDCEAPVNNNEEYGSVVRTRLGKHSLVFGAEVDCRDAQTGDYIELKTNRQITSYRQRVNFHRYKLLKWWMQSFLIGIPRIVAGFRDDSGIVRYIEEMKTSELPNMAQQTDCDWRGTVCLNFLDQLLSFIKDNVTDSSSTNVFYIFEWQPGDDVTCRREEITDENNFLSDWYKNKIFQ